MQGGFQVPKDGVVAVRNTTRGTDLAGHLEVAHRLFARMKGLLGRRGLPPGHGLLIYPCNSVHALGMAFEIDVVHVSRDGHVLRVLTPLRRNTLGPLVRRSYYTLELPAGTVAATGTEVGDLLAFLTADRLQHG